MINAGNRSAIIFQYIHVTTKPDLRRCLRGSNLGVCLLVISYFPAQLLSLISFRVLLTLFLFLDAAGMFHKRGLPDLAALPPEKRLRNNIADLFLTNDVSGCRTKSIYDDAKAAGVVNLTGLTSSSSSNIRSADGVNLIMHTLECGIGNPRRR